MKPTLPRLRTLVLTLLTVGLASVAGAAMPFHFALVKSMPADKATVHHVPEVKLWFTEAPSDNTISIRVLNAEGSEVPAGDLVQDKEDETVFSVPFPEALGAGAYTVSWRGMGDDGHVVRGDFTFTVAGH